MRDGHDFRLRRMFEVVVASSNPLQLPTVIFNYLDNFRRAWNSEPPLSFQMIERMITRVNIKFLKLLLSVVYGVCRQLAYLVIIACP